MKEVEAIWAYENLNVNNQTLIAIFPQDVNGRRGVTANPTMASPELKEESLKMRSISEMII